MPNSRERQERYQRLQQRRNIRMSSQPTSREVSPTPRRIPGGSNPDVREAVQMMVTEVTMFDQIMEKINSLVAEVREYKEQNDARLQRHEEALEHRMQEGTLDQEQPADSNLHQPQERELDQEDPVQQLRRQLEERNRELEETRLQLLRMNAAPVPVVHTRKQEIQELRHQLEERNRDLTEARQRLQGSGVAPAPMECAQDREIQELRRQLKQQDQEQTEVRRLAPSVQHSMTRCQDHHQQPPVINGSRSPSQPLPRSRPHTLIPEQQLYPERQHMYEPQTSLLQQFRPRSSPQRP
ncbi:arginine and glutamate-rich protein 1-like [Penaeus vannamei]|uniref:arginine and glutamate-rich protein 1-like n=1 Tax=Penaeus vannamei TaxID=6689 RepID=UPI00387F94E0